MIKQWLEHCLDTHQETCPETASRLPNRVIDVGSNHRRPRLHTTDAKEKGNYCALSYCWGDSVAFRTETSTYGERKTGFDLEALPKTIRDAVLLVRGLGIRYLWVDSLCIIQDSVLDWECEAALMGDIYSRAFIVIAAVDAPDNDTGLFHEDERRRIQRVGADHESVFVRQDFHNGVAGWGNGQPIKQLTENALHKRGWTLQEVALASRMVWFKSGEISWSCVRSTACECRPELLNIIHSENYKSHLLQTIAYLRSSGANRSQWLEKWHSFVGDYCTRKFSDVRDRLPAIAGVAIKMQGEINCRYLFGFWDNETFLDRLIWHCNKAPKHESSFDPRHFPPCDYAPTWSWASCSVSSEPGWLAPKLRYTNVWILESMKIDLSTSNPFGPGRGALHLHSLIVPVTRDFKDSRQIRYSGPMKDTITSRSESKIASRVAVMLLRNSGFELNDSRIDYVHTSDWYQGKELSFIFGKIDDKTKSGEFVGLLLERLEGAERGLHRYRRLGLIVGSFARPSEVQVGTSWEIEKRTRSEIIFVKPTWEYWQKLGKWETIVLV
ncbi:heterokaryon incompatibility protein-domain-containing protein [Boeremia exigua]|uniref:heterokaryon incompatibility protein-domain-containing protein n=1 Tax=Boeremia exigua TaxID=749465 RepID=UPI001E8DD41A|nr:heterokaryon incompatibility protein-domain-containing protein [Boeremia exigua]KAH6625589.1 heterokaryon incompatibility protein-domain-containing protein [Boeremia exigua]